MEEVRSFKKVERSYHSTPNGWRLATFEEAKNGLEAIKEQSLLKKWERARLLDGWISGPGYEYQMGNDFRSCLGYMLLVETQTAAHISSGCAYADVNISDSQKQVALFLCVDDCNYEVVYWLFNSWAKTDSMDLQDVIDGRIPFSNFAKFKEMSSKVCSLARKLGDKGPVSVKAAKVRFSGPDSVKGVLSDMIKTVNEEKLEQYNINNFFDVGIWKESCFPSSLEHDWLKDVASSGGADWNDIADAIWNFLSECFAGTMVEIVATLVLAQICKLNDECDMKTITSSQKNFMVASLILFCLSEYRTDIIHTPLVHNCRGSCVAKMICCVASNNGPADLPRFNQTLQNNAMWRCYDHIGNYDLLNKLLVVVASREVSRVLRTDNKPEILVVNRLLECGAQPGPAYAILREEKVTALSVAIIFVQEEDSVIEVAKSLLNKCDEKQQEKMANAPYEAGWTVLHIASLKGEANTCQMLLDYGAKLDVPSEHGQTALHIAVTEGKDTVVSVFLKHRHIIELVDLEDKMGQSPIDIAVAKRDIKLVAKLITKSKQPEAYFDQVDLKQLLRYSLLDGSVYIVRNLFEKGTKLSAGECDDEGKTALHLAAMCKDVSKAMEMVRLVLESIEGKEELVAKCDRRGRSALQEAALNGNEELCKYLLGINPKIINSKDRNDQNPIYDAAKAEQNGKSIVEMLLAVYPKKDTLNALIDRNGLTPLHVAASLGKKDLVQLLLSSQKNSREYLKRRDPTTQNALEYLKRRDPITQNASEYLKISDFLGQTALHKAANYGDSDTVKILLKEGAHPLKERDCDGRTALHYAVQAKTVGDKRKLVNSLLEGCKTNEEKWLLLWASAAGLGTADNSLSNDDPLHRFLVDKKEEIKTKLTTGNLLKTATSVGDIEMTKELLARGYEIADIRDTEWKKGLTEEGKKNVERVSRQLERIAEQGNDQPTVLDNLGRIDYAHGLAALLLNPYIKPPIVVGISGTWGMGKSSVMVQTESILLKTAAQMALLPSAKLSSSASQLPEIRTSELSKKGKKKYEEIKRHVDFEQKGNRNLFSRMMDKIWSWIKKSNREESRPEIGHTKQDSLAEFLNSYQVKYRKIFKSLAAMDSSDMFTKRARQDQEPQNPHSKSMGEMARDMFITNNQRSKSSPQQSAADSTVEESVPAVLTVQYNAWKYSNETEALAGMAVEITKELEGIMSEAQWLSTCWRNTWKKKKYNIWIEIIYPCLLAVVLACTITWILWVILDRSDKFKDWAIPKYACLPTAIVIIGWTVTKSVMGILKPVSTQLMSYISFPDHTDKLGYQERVISDINFLKDEIGKRPCMIFKAYSWVFSVISTLWLLFIEWWFTPLFFHPRILGKAMLIPKIAPASGTNLRIIVFIDDLDRCQESVILQVLSAINLVLAVCEINVVLGIDKGLIERAIIKNYGDMKPNRSFKDNQELADKYLQKIIQLPLDLPDPSEEQSRTFLEGQLGVFKEPSEGSDSELKPNAEAGRSRESTSSDITEGETGPVPDLETGPSTTVVTGCSCTRLILQSLRQQLCKLFFSPPSVFCGRKDETEATTSDAAATLSAQTGIEAQQQGDVLIAKQTVNKISNRNHWSWIPIRELLFIRYSKGEQDAFCYFQKLATDTRKLPREWKRHLTYHRLVWYIFYLTGEAKDLAGWQVQLITWIFVCWEWQENLNFIIQNWNKVGALKSIESNGPSLQMIVDHFIELENKKHMKGTVASPEKVETKEAITETRDTTNRNNETESSKTEQKKSEKASKEIMPGVDAGPSEKTLREELDELKKEITDVKDIMPRVDAGPLEEKSRKELDELKKEIKDLKDIIPRVDAGPLEETSRKELDELKKEIKDLKDIMLRVDAGPLEETLRKELEELKKEIKDLKDNMPRVDAGPLEETLRKEMDGLKKEIKDEFNKEIKDLKDQVMKQHSMKNEKREEEKKMKLKRWKRLRSALQKYDIPMDGILSFQRFRFYCIAGHLSWPLPEQENDEH